MPESKYPRNRRRRKPPIRQLTQVEAAWMGALIEGEGSTFFRRDDHRRGSAIIQVANTDPELMSVCLRVVQTGHVTVNRIRHGKLQMQWALAGNEAVDLAEQLTGFCAKTEKLLHWQ